MKRALVLGPGQDGSYLCEILLERNYEVHVMHRRSSVDNLRRIRHLLRRMEGTSPSPTLHRGDMTDQASLWNVLRTVEPDEIYVTADQDDVSWSRDIASYSWDVTAGGPLRLLECMVRLQERGDLSPNCRVFVPLSVTMFGLESPPQNEDTSLDPRSPFACAKAAAWHLCRHYRQDRGVWVACGIMFNHDSPSRSEDYVLHKICKAAVRIARGEQKELVLGNLDQRIDIGFARDYMEAAVAMLQTDKPRDYVIGTGTAWSIRCMVYEAFAAAKVSGDVSDYVRVDPKFQRPGPQPTYIADPTRAERMLGWKAKTGVGALIGMLVKHEQEN